MVCRVARGKVNPESLEVRSEHVCPVLKTLDDRGILPAFAIRTYVQNEYRVKIKIDEFNQLLSSLEEIGCISKTFHEGGRHVAITDTGRNLLARIS